MKSDVFQFTCDVSNQAHYRNMFVRFTYRQNTNTHTQLKVRTQNTQTHTIFTNWIDTGFCFNAKYTNF